MRVRFLTLSVLLCLVAWIATPIAQQPGPESSRAVDGEIIVKFKAGVPQARRDAALKRIGGSRIKHFAEIDQDHVRLPRGRKAAEAIAALLATGEVQAAQPNYIRRIVQSPPPNDYFWVNRVQTDFYQMEKIKADQVWFTYTTGSAGVVVADIDTGVKYDHVDLAANMWVNPGEIAGNLQDDDNNGYIDDIHGIKVNTPNASEKGDPMDDNGHGTHTAGTMGGVGNNAEGVVGVNWTVKILACKFLDASGFGSDSGAIECFNYITMMKNRGVNIRVSNNSWGAYRHPTDPFPQAMKDAIDAAGNADILNVFAAGNNNVDIDTSPHDPASFDSPSIVSVAASDDTDARASFSNYGVTSVDLAAPGVFITSTYIDLANPTCAPCYAYASGTSMAAPHVAGAAALLAAKSPSYPASELKSLLLANVDPVAAWNGFVATGGRLNVFDAAQDVAGNTAPAVTITSPPDGVSIPNNISFTLSADATDVETSVAKVDFYFNGSLITTDTASPYTIGIAGLPVGTHVLSAQATDTAGAIGFSAPVTITIYSAAPPTATLSASSLMFGKQLVGSTSAPRSVSITNHGPDPLFFNLFNGATPASNFIIGAAGNFQGQTTCPLGLTGLAPNASCQFTFRSTPTVTGPHGENFAISTNAANASSHSIFLSGHGFIVDEATVNQTIAVGAARLQNLQNPNDGGWNFNVASADCGTPGVSCPNIVGVTALGLLKAYERTANATLLSDAIDAGNRLKQVYNTVPRPVPYSQDLEFLMALKGATTDAQWSTMAADWFLTVTAAHPNGGDRVDWLLATRGSLAAWDSASLIRSAKAVGEGDYALEVANRIRDREADWLGVGNPSHTYVGVGSLLWAWHDLVGFETEINTYRAQALAFQDPATGLWDNGNLQATAYIVKGLAAVGGTDTDAAIRKAVAFYIANQLPANGWTFTAGGTSEYSNVDSEVIRAIGTLYNTQAGSSVQVAPAQLSSVTFDQVSTSGSTTVVALDRTAAGTVPVGYSLVGGLTYEILTTAVASGNITVCLSVPWAATAGMFDRLRILHAEAGVFVDRTIRTGAMAPDFGSKRVCALVSSLDAFAVGIVDETTPPQLSVTLSPAVLSPANNQMVTVTATIGVTDNADPSPVITLMSITTSDGKHPKRDDVQGAAIGTDDRTFSLRAERAEGGAERVYTITYRATDRSGNSTDTSATAVVPGRR